MRISGIALNRFAWRPPKSRASAAPKVHARRLSDYAILAALLSFVYVSPSILQLLHWHYDGAGGGIQNIHPGTYLLFGTLFGLCLVRHDYFHNIAMRFLHDPGLLGFAIMSLATALYAIVVQHCSIMPFVETFGVTIVVFMMFREAPAWVGQAFRYGVDLFMVVNIAIIMAEYFLKRNLIPVFHYSPVAVQAGLPAGFDRPTGMFGLPLLAAGFLSVYAIANVIRQLKFHDASHVRAFVGGASLLAAALTGSRTAVITALVVILLLFLFASGRMVFTGHARKAEHRALFWWGVVGLVAVPLALHFGLFDLLVSRFQNDHGSSSTRDIALQIVMSMSPYDMLLGSGPDTIWVQQQIYGLIAIEISWVNFIIVCGLLFTVPLFVSYCAFLFGSLRRCCHMAYAPALFFLVVHASSIGLWAKSTSFAAEIAILLAYTGRTAVTSFRPMRRNILPYSFHRRGTGSYATTLTARFGKPGAAMRGFREKA